MILFRFSQDIGLASLGVSDDDIVKLSTLYWFTVEFGLCRENGKIKAYGAGNPKHSPLVFFLRFNLSLSRSSFILWRITTCFIFKTTNKNIRTRSNGHSRISRLETRLKRIIKECRLFDLDEDYQPIYFLAETFEDAKEKLRIYAKSLKRPYDLVYDAHTQSLRILDNVQVIHDLSIQLKLQMDVIEHALDRLQANGINFRVVS